MGRKELRYKIGEIVTINNKKYIVIESKDIYGCTPCDLQSKCFLDPYLYGAGLCTESARPDKKGIIYKRVE